MHNIHAQIQEVPPTILTIFGATGDLSADYLMPALFNMDREGMLPKSFRLVAVGRRDFNTKSYLDFIIKKSRSLKKVTPKQKNHFLKHLLYYKGNLDDAESFKPLAKILADNDERQHTCYNRLYYFATTPQLFASIAHVLQRSGLLMACTAHQRQVRVLVEKPFGFNFESAQALNRLLLKYFTEEQIYRIDHYQGKETVQNLMVVRFANSIFEPLWNKDNVDHIEISVLEKDTAKERAEFYDQAGALKDFVQNHILQLLSLITMDEPKELTVDDIRNEKVKILRALQPFGPETVGSNVVKGQYGGYRADVGYESPTETYVALKASINTPRWQGVPMYLRTGKALNKKIAEISIHFKEKDRCLFKGCASNIITFRIQPDESVHLRLNNKVPGFGVELHQGDYEFGYDKAFAVNLSPAYERLLLDFIQGDQRLFIRSDEIEAAWKFIDSITANWKDVPLYPYGKKTAGPSEADAWISKDIREWWTK